jgi:putative transposase
MVRPAARREVTRYLQQHYAVSERRACRTITFSRATLRYRSRLDPRTALRIRMRDIAYSRIRYGYRRVRVMLVREGWKISKNLVYRLYREEGLVLRTGLRRRRRSPVQRQVRVLPTAPNHAWTLDFVSDQLLSGARFRALTLLDVHTRVCLAIEIGTHLRGEQVVAALEQWRRQYGPPRALFCDNGSEFASRVVDFWAYQYGVRIDFSRPGKPTDNGHIEAFNGSFRRECLNAHWFKNLDGARQRIEAWRRDYNEIRPHRALNDLTPRQYAETWNSSPGASP